MNDVAGMLTVRGEERGKRRREERHRARGRELWSFRDVIMSSVKKGNVSAPLRNETMLLPLSLSLPLSLLSVWTIPGIKRQRELSRVSAFRARETWRRHARGSEEGEKIGIPAAMREIPWQQCVPLLARVGSRFKTLIMSTKFSPLLSFSFSCSCACWFSRYAPCGRKEYFAKNWEKLFLGKYVPQACSFFLE